MAYNTRMCVCCRTKTSPDGLLRAVRLPDGNVEIDDSGKKNGRGAYVCPTERCIEGARKRGSLEKALKVKFPSDIYDNLLKRVRSVND